MSRLRAAPLEERVAFVRAHTAIVRVPLVPELQLYTASDVTPLWRATQGWLGATGIDVPFWCVPWAGGQALARFVLDHPERVRGRRVVDFAAGSGIVGLACAQAGAASVRAVDIDPLAEAACILNAEANALTLDVVCEDAVGTSLHADVIVAGDIWYDRGAARRFSVWLAERARAGVDVITADPGRAYVPTNLVELERHEVPTTLDLESTTSRTSRVLWFG